MKNSIEIQRKQTTSYGGYSQEVRLETGDNEKVLSISEALENGRNVESEYANNLMEKILARTNMNVAYQRVVRNKGSHGIDGMKVDEILTYLKGNGEALCKNLLEGRYMLKPVMQVEIPKV